MSALRQVALRVADFPRHERRVRPAVVGPQHRYQSGREQGGREGAGCHAWGEVAEAAATRAEGEQAEGEQRRVLERRGDALQGRGPLHAEVVDRADDEDGERGDVAHLRVSQAHEVAEVLGEDRRDRPERGGADHGQLRPAEQERGQRPVCLEQIGEDAARARQRARQLRDRERAAQRDDAAEDPAQENRPRRVQLRGDRRGHAEDAAADRYPHRDRDGLQQSHRARHALAPLVSHPGVFPR